jgi:glycosyltransferase involved in cell wall biosynthesis
MWQPFAAKTRHCDLVIVTQENKHLNNLPLLLNPWRQQRLAFWGHGRNLQSTRPDGLAERFKRWTTRHVDWWFTYTDMSAAFVRDAGFACERITVLNNSIDTSSLQRAVADAAQQPRPTLRKALGLGNGPVAVFVGSMYAEKRIDFMLKAAAQIASQVPGFELALAGDGPERASLEEATKHHHYVHWLGPRQGKDKATLLAAADIMLSPGAVGLGVLDAFIAGAPLVTLDGSAHGPEISYLQSGQNGLIVPDSLTEFTQGVVNLLTNPTQLAALQRGARESAGLYSIEAMAERFAMGIRAALAVPLLA